MDEEEKKNGMNDPDDERDRKEGNSSDCIKGQVVPINVENATKATDDGTDCGASDSTTIIEEEDSTTIIEEEESRVIPPGQRSDLKTEPVKSPDDSDIHTSDIHTSDIHTSECGISKNPLKEDVSEGKSDSQPVTPFALTPSPSRIVSQVLVQSNVHAHPLGHSSSASGNSSLHKNSPVHSQQPHTSNQVPSTSASGHSSSSSSGHSSSVSTSGHSSSSSSHSSSASTSGHSSSSLGHSSSASTSGHTRSLHPNFDEIIEEISSNTSSGDSTNVMDPEAGHSSDPFHYLGGSISYHPSMDQGSMSPSMNVHPPSNDYVDMDTNIELLSSTPLEVVQEAIMIRGNGNMTLFGLSNTFNNEFPPNLLGHVSKEEFEVTINKINDLLKSHHSTNAKILLLGCLCCCCSFGCSLLWPTIALSKRTRNSLEKLINIENHRLYHKLGLNWKIDKQRCHSNHAFMEYVLVIEFIPKLHLYQPD